MKHKRKLKKLKKLKRRANYIPTCPIKSEDELLKKQSEAIRARIDRPNLYRLYLRPLNEGIYEAVLDFDLLKVLEIIEQSMEVEDESTLYTLIQTGDRINHGDRILLSFYNMDSEIMGKSIYYKTKEQLLSDMCPENNLTLTRTK